MYNWELFKNRVSKIYMTKHRSMALWEVLEIFSFYFNEYEVRRGAEHPAISNESLARIIDKMPSIDDGHWSVDVLTVAEYEQMIAQHFDTEYRSCDYNIIHFFSGAIRMNRYLETCQ